MDALQLYHDVKKTMPPLANMDLDVFMMLAGKVLNEYIGWKAMRCAVCDKELSKADREAISPAAFHVTCEEHNGYQHTFDLWRVRTELGLPGMSEWFVTANAELNKDQAPPTGATPK